MPKKRTLPYILLGLIHSNRQLTGYQMMQEFKNEISDFWTASHSQIYPELQRMASDHWIEAVVKDASMADKRHQTYYQLTYTGEKVLTEWLQEPLTKANDDLFPLKLFFIDNRDSQLLPPLIHRQLELSSARLAYLKDRMTTVFPNQSAIQARYGHYLTLSRGIERENNYVNWLRELNGELNNK